MKKAAFVLCVAATTAVAGAACSRSDRSATAEHAAPAANTATREAAGRVGEPVHVAGDTRAGDTRSETRHAPDNTGVNARDRDGNTLTATDQSERAADRTLTQQVRRAIVSDDSLSTNAHNVKIITVDGVVTLRGPVKSPQERSSIVAKANQVAGVKRLDDQLEVASE
jgi:osmotically-inducible protein OsmY